MEAVGQLTGGIAHDFNNLLMAVAEQPELRDGARRARPRRMPWLIDNAIARARTRRGALTQQLLAFCRKQELAPETSILPLCWRT